MFQELLDIATEPETPISSKQQQYFINLQVQNYF